VRKENADTREFKVGDVVSYEEKGNRTGLVVQVGHKWVHVEILGKDPRIKRIRKFPPEALTWQYNRSKV